MTKADVVDIIATATGLSKVETEAVINGFLATVSDALMEGKRVDFRGFGSFSVKKRASKIGQNPGTGEAVPIPVRFVPVFKPSKMLKEAVDKNMKQSR
ncbi:MAG: integration host factor subunit beta [Candidatus Marinimicrobia bacterium]|nr:integration host factor subunit beta [Candidatus Neomarinimicrobiota bacterium]MDD5583092.1 integration host factor subunit beta [Candidatus Neomarinimicrobiota bacterium]